MSSVGASYFRPMRHLLFLLTLGFYGFAAMDLHEWARVPQVLVHLLEHHSEFGHHHDDASDHGHGDEEEHNPFKGHADEACASMTLWSVAADHTVIVMTVPSMERGLIPLEDEDALMAHTGSKWNPPKQG